ncbi:MAG: cytochrome c [Pirellulales bacterium]|nr:cytochrome c [Pirellulales bacterium]
MGVRTVVSVDGVKPNIQAAAKQGLRYIHIPIGYDGVGPEAQGALTRLVREVKGPIYIHCHHGQHRGPAAAAVACMAAGSMSRAQATAYLKQAGTGAEYAGLWRDVAQFTALPAGARLPPLVETAEVDSLAAAMAELDRAWDGLKLCRAAGWQTPAESADIAPEHQSLLVWENLREAERANEYPDPQLAEWLHGATLQAEQLRQSLQQGRPEAATAAYKRLEAACAQCHKQYRN